MDVHKEAISITVLNSSGKLVMECAIETKAITILDFLKELRGSLHVTLEEGTWAAWLYDLIKPHLAELVVCNPRRNALLKRYTTVSSVPSLGNGRREHLLLNDNGGWSSGPAFSSWMHLVFMLQ
jgi:hypothetical protein